MNGQSDRSTGIWGELTEDPVAFLIVMTVGGVAILGALPVWVEGVAAWLIQQHILVAATGHPLLPIPGLDGAGLDVRRIIVALAATVALAAAAFFPIRARLRREA